MPETHPLKAFRKTHTPSLSQEQLAKHLGVSRLTITRWETGERKVSMRNLADVVERTGIPAAELRPDLAELMAPAESAQ